MSANTTILNFSLSGPVLVQQCFVDVDNQKAVLQTAIQKPAVKEVGGLWGICLQTYSTAQLQLP